MALFVHKVMAFYSFILLFFYSFILTRSQNMFFMSFCLFSFCRYLSMLPKPSISQTVMYPAPR